MKYEIQLDRKVGTDHPCYIIAEIGSNHNRDFKTALKLIDVAKAAGCDAAKFQSYTAEGIYSKLTPRLSEMEGRSHKGETPFELIKRIEMPVEWHADLKAYCDKVGITFCSTPFDESMN
jgi:sialic acid synthase SpsE